MLRPHLREPYHGVFELVPRLLLSGIMVTFMALSVGLLHIHYAHHPSKWTVLIMAFGPLALAWFVSLVWNPVLLHRALIGSSPFLYIIVAYPVEKLLEGQQVKSWREAAIALALVVSRAEQNKAEQCSAVAKKKL